MSKDETGTADGIEVEACRVPASGMEVEARRVPASPSPRDSRVTIGDSRAAGPQSDTTACGVMRLGIVFDIDGTLVTDDGPSETATLRPHAVEMLRWCKDRGHRLALFSAAGEGRVLCMKEALCTAVSGPHRCSLHCKRVFEFTWAGNRLCGLENPKFAMDFQGDGRCGWCGYQNCDRCVGCTGHGYSGYCPCRQVKKLQKVWSSNSRQQLGFTRERTVILENTPQQCFLNYGNAFYVRTFDAASDPTLDTDLAAFQGLVQKLETEPDVRNLRKCACAGPAFGYHACTRQTWWWK